MESCSSLQSVTNSCGACFLFGFSSIAQISNKTLLMVTFLRLCPFGDLGTIKNTNLLHAREVIILSLQRANEKKHQKF